MKVKYPVSFVDSTKEIRYTDAWINYVTAVPYDSIIEDLLKYNARAYDQYTVVFESEEYFANWLLRWA